MKSIAIITARGGSKRIPRKNIKDFCGKPIISYSIQAAIRSELFDEVMVSTDDVEIAEISLMYGAKVPFYRSNDTANDYSVTSDVIREVLLNYKEKGREFDIFCCMYPTAPFITSETLKSAMVRLTSTYAESLLPVVKYSFPPQRCVIIDNERVRMKWPQHRNSRSQDLEPYYHDCGQFYLMKTEPFLRKNTLITDNTIPFILKDMEVQDIDTLEDWKLAELKYTILRQIGD